MTRLEQVVYLADDGEWRFWESELPHAPHLVEPQLTVPAFWDPEVKVELNEWLPLPNKYFQYHRLVIPVERWFPKLERTEQEVAGLKLLIAVAERLLAERTPIAEPAETVAIRDCNNFTDWHGERPPVRPGHFPVPPQVYELPDDCL